MAEIPILGVFHGTGNGSFDETHARRQGTLPKLARDLRKEGFGGQLVEFNGVGVQTQGERTARRDSRIYRAIQQVKGDEIEDIISAGVSDLENKIKAALDNNDNPNISLVGFSRGGATSLVVANRLAERYKDNPRVKINLNMVDPVPGGPRYNQRKYHELSPHLNSVTNILALNDTRPGYRPVHTANMHMPGPASVWESKVIEVGLPGTHADLTNAKQRTPEELEPTTNITEAILKHSLRSQGIPVTIDNDRHNLAMQFHQLANPATSSARSGQTSGSDRLKGGRSAGARNSVKATGRTHPRGNTPFNGVHLSQDSSLREPDAHINFINNLIRYKPSRDLGHKRRLRIQQKQELLTETTFSNPNRILAKYEQIREKKMTGLTSIVRDYLYDAPLRESYGDNITNPEQQVKLGRIQVLHVDLQRAGYNNIRGSLLQKINHIQDEARQGRFDSSAYEGLVSTCERRSEQHHQSGNHMSRQADIVDRFLQAEGRQYRQTPEAVAQRTSTMIAESARKGLEMHNPNNDNLRATI